MLKKYLMIFISSLLSGFCIVIGTTVYLVFVPESKFLGSLLFGIGLFTIIHFNLYLYTGKVGFCLDNKLCYLYDLLVCVLGNFIGVFLLATVLKQTRIYPMIEVLSKSIVLVKQNDSLLSSFILSFMCGVLIYLAVKGHKECSYALGKVIFAFVPIVVFIYSCYEHCVANVAFFTFAEVNFFEPKVMLYFLVIIIGNGLGSITFDGLLKLVNKLKED